MAVGQGLFEERGGRPQKQVKFTNIFTDELFTGLYTQRAALHSSADFLTRRFYGGRSDALLDGANIELTNRLTLARRPGLTPFSSAIYPTAPNTAFSFEPTNGTIQVIVDCGSTGDISLTAVDEISGVAYYHFTSTQANAANNQYEGLIFQITGFDDANNNGTFTCTYSTSSYMILDNTLAVTDSATANAISSGAVYYDEQDGGATYSLSAVDMISGVAYYHFTATQAAADNNGFENRVFTITGFDDAVNNGVFECTASTSAYMVLNNLSAITDTYSASAQSTDKILLFAKNPGAGQCYFTAVAGVLYAGDGVDTRKYIPNGTNQNPDAGYGASGNVWNWGGEAPTDQPTVTIVESGSAATVWQASTVYSTMGLLLDSNGNAEFLTGVNASGTNTTQLGKTGNGQPLWNNTQGSQTADGSCNWTNWGIISTWKPGTLVLYESAVLAPNGYIFQATGGLTGVTEPAWTSTPNTHCADNGSGNKQWQNVGQAVVWQGKTSYHAWWEHSPCIVCQPILPTAANIASGTQPVYLMTNNDQTTGSNDDPGISGSGYTPPWPSTAGLTTTDGDLQWISLGSATWAASTDVFAWSEGSTTFSVVEDPYGDFQVCIGTGKTGSAQPYTQWQASHSYTAGSSIGVQNGSQFILFTSGSGTHNSGSSQPSWNFTPTSTTSDGAVTWTCTGTVLASVWGNKYGSQTNDGSATWVNVGPTITWATSTQWYYQSGGFAPPTTAQPYGGAIVIGNNYVQCCTSTGKSGSTQPTWPALTQDYVLTSVANASGQTAVYTGTIGAPANSLVGYVFTVSGFAAHPQNNGTNFICTANNGSTTITLINPNASSESAGATIACTVLNSNITDNTVNWFTESAASANSLAWSNGYCYAYSFYARLPGDYYNTNTPPGWPRVLGTPTGCELGTCTTASPVFTITGSNAGAVNTLVGEGSGDPQFDTIIIWRCADGEGSDNMYFLTEIPMPQPIQGTPQAWTFQDYLPDTPQTISGVVYPGLNNLIPAPIDDQNDPPPSTFLPMAFNFNRIWGADGTDVLFTGGPDVLVGNPQECFNPSDEFQYLAGVTRLVKTSQGLAVLLTDEIDIICGGPLTSSFYNVVLCPGVGLKSYNSCDVYAGEIYFLAADSEFQVISPSLSLSNQGFPVGNIFAGDSTYTAWDTSQTYVAVFQNGLDNCLFVVNPEGGEWVRNNPAQIPGSYLGPEATWSPRAYPVGGVQMVQSLETSPGIRQLLVGSPNGGNQIMVRNLNVFTDNGTEYDAWWLMGSIVLCNPGQIGILRFIEGDFSANANVTMSYLLNEIEGVYPGNPGTDFTTMPDNLKLFDPPQLYGNTLAPTSYSPFRWYFSSTGSLARARHLQIYCSYGMSSLQDEVMSISINGALMQEK